MRAASSAGRGQDGALTIQQVARRTGLSVPTLRYYEQIGLVPPVPRDPSSGHRRYPGSAVERIESLAHLRAAGLSIDAMRTLMSTGGHDADGITAKLGQLVAHRDRVAVEIAALTTRLRYLDNRIDYWRAELAGDAATAAKLAHAADVLVRELT
ncbi:MerR family transcriptional regulator [Nakamurella endophytica]|uniref:HTH merR-type domain-containing protein n=1 Tax=Nakamurella endophytica TaxID=1748367 RepID=A0A917WFM9_9ACTN|nr:MerR family transcriptional regulator [Nakamurella endophytica]GGL98481.1 hypothetical protein GCM10011594_17970 [Nakamurella endophytica]